MKKTVFNLLIISISMFCMGFLSQTFANPADMDPSFDTGIPIGFETYPSAVAYQSDGKILVGGGFSSYQGVSANKIIRLNCDGSIDTSLNLGNGFNGNVFAIAPQSDGKILIGGAFSSYQGVSANKIIRLNKNGSRDTTFEILSGFDGVYGVSSILVQPDGKILVVGAFSSYQGVSANKIIRLNNDGSIDETFNVGAGYSSYISKITLQSNGKILLVWNGTLLRLNSDGSIDTSFNLLNFDVNGFSSVAVQSNGKIIIAGTFTTYNGTSANRIIRLNNDGSRDTTFNIGNGFNNSVSSMILQPDGKVVVGGTFTSYNGFSVNGTIRLNSDGSRDTTFNIGNGFNVPFNDGLVYLHNKIILIGQFTNLNGVSLNRIARLNSDGSRDTTFNIGNGFDNSVSSIVIQTDGKILVGGSFTSYRGQSFNRLLRLNSGGSIDTTFGIGSGFDNSVSTIVIQSDGKILVGGSFTNYNGSTANRIIRLNSDGSIDTSFNVGDGFGAGISTISLQSNGKILVGFGYTTFNGTYYNGIIRLNSDGSRDSTFYNATLFGGNMRSVSTIAIQLDGKILIGGSFSNGYLTRLNEDSSIDTGFNGGSSITFSDYPTSLAIQTDGNIIVGGRFTTCKGVSKNKICRITSTGLVDTTFNIGNGFTYYVYSVKLDPDGKILVGGNFSTYNGESTNNLIRLNNDGSRDTGFNVGGGFYNGVGYNPYSISTIAIQSDGRVLVGGNFTNYKSGVAGYMTRLYGGTQDIVIMPNTTNETEIISEFTGKGYVEDGGNLVGSTAISLSETDGLIPVELNIKNSDITLNMSSDTQFKTADNVSNYNGIISVPVLQDITSLYDKNVLIAFNVGSSAESTLLEGGIANLIVPINGKSIGDFVYIYYSEDNGVNRYLKGMAKVEELGGDTYISFSTNQLTEYAILDGTGMLSINNSNSTVLGTQEVTLTTDLTGVVNMRFSNDGSSWSSREYFDTIKDWTLTSGAGIKTVYAQFDTNDDNISDIQTSDEIYYLIETYGCTDPDAPNYDSGANTDDGSCFAPIYGCTDPDAANYDSGASADDGRCTYIGCTDSDATNYDENANTDDGSCVYPEIELNVDNITQDPFNCDVAATECNLNGMGITSIASGTFINHASLLSVDLSSNYISSLEDGDFYGLSGLVELDLYQNKITGIENGDFNGLTASGLYIDIGENNISKLYSGTFNGLSNLNELDIYACPITEIETGAFYGLDNIQYLYLSNLKIRTLTPGMFVGLGSSLESLGFNDWEYNLYPAILEEIQTGTFDNLTGLKSLNLYGNIIKSLPSDLFDNLINLTEGSDILGNNCIDTSIEFTNSIVQSVDRQSTQKVCAYISYDPSSTSTTGSVTGTILFTGGSSADRETLNGNDIISHTRLENGLFGFNLATISNSGLLHTNSLLVTGSVTWIEESPEDAESPVISGITDGGIYTTSVTFTATDNVGVTSALLDGNSLISWANYTVSNVGVHTLIIFDAANNSTTITFEIKAPTSNGGGGGGNYTKKDDCPKGDNTNSYYDQKCEEKNTPTEKKETIKDKIIDIINKITPNIIIPPKEEIIKSMTIHGSAEAENELAEGYQFALENKITTISNVEEAQLDGILTREQMAKMVSNYMTNIMGVTGTKYNTKECSNFTDISDLTKEMKGYAIVSCQLGLMGIDGKGGILKSFNPKLEVTRAQFGTILSRMLRGNKYDGLGGSDWYKNHLNALKKEGIMTKTDNPYTKELRGWVMVMMKRANEIYKSK